MTTDQNSDERRNEIRQIHREYKLFYLVSGGFGLILFGVWLGWQIFPSEKLIDYNINLWNTLIGAGITVLVIDRLNDHRQRTAEERQLKEDLISRMGSSVNSEARRAIEQLEHLQDRKNEPRPWLTDGSLRQQSFRKADLQDTELFPGTDLQEADFENANLQNIRAWSVQLENAQLFAAQIQNADLTLGRFDDAILHRAQLRGAILLCASLVRANLTIADFQQADLRQARLYKSICVGTNFQAAYLQDADLEDAHLFGADFRGANLEGSNLKQAKLIDPFFDIQTILPDKSNWTPTTDMTRFTNPSHNSFWRSENPRSPAYNAL